MGVAYHCKNIRRRDAVRESDHLNGIDYLEVLDQDAPDQSTRQRTLLVQCLKPLPPLTATDVRIEGGVRISPVKVEWAARAIDAGALFADALISETERDYFLNVVSEPDQVVVVRTDSEGDFSDYRLFLTVQPVGSPPINFDPQLSAIDFLFKVECPTDFDCQTDVICLPEEYEEPHLDYLAKDYASFRRLMFDRMSALIPDWLERNPADSQVALVELLAYVGDHLSYFQDAVATEAYLGTARKRVSIRRHARLLDYRMHEGCAARTWVCLEVDSGGGADGLTLPASTLLLTQGESQDSLIEPVEAQQLLTIEKPEAFVSLHDIQLRSAHNGISFYTWTDTECCLPRGSTQATLQNDPPVGLKEGDVLLFEEIRSPTTGSLADADPSQRYAVRLTQVEPDTDPLDGTAVVNIAWHAEDALPFPFCLSAVVEGETLTDVSIARGNVVLVEHGRWVGEELDAVPVQGHYRPALQRRDLTHRLLYNHEKAQEQAAAAVMKLDTREALPDVELTGEVETWTAQRDLLGSDRFAPEFVVEMEDDGRAVLRFGNGVFGKRPTHSERLSATYRIGNGRAGNVGAEVISRLVLAGSGVSRVWNPLPATGGTDPERAQQVRLFAPQAFRRQERAVTETDYAEVVQRHPGVQKAVATRRWTGSWYTMFVTIDRTGGRVVNSDFEQEILVHLERYRMAGVDVEIDGPIFVPLDIVLRVCVEPGHFRSDVKQALLQALSSQELERKRRGFFHPDRFTFGQPVYLSQLYQAAMAVDGVDWVEVTKFQRWGKAPNKEIEDGVLSIGRLEVVRLDNSPNFPENGKLECDMLGGV